MLNSVLIEGIAADLPIGDDVVGITTFTLKTENRKDFGNVQNLSGFSCHFPIHCKGNLAQHITKNIKQRQGLRIVGYLAMDDTGKPFLHAEHIELKPLLPKKTKAKAS